MTRPNVQQGINELAAEVAKVSDEHGFAITLDRLPEKLLLAVSELSEATEELRHVDIGSNGILIIKDRLTRVRHVSTGYGHKPEGFTVELADCIIRCLHILHWLGADTQALLEEKIAFNAKRPHKHGRTF